MERQTIRDSMGRVLGFLEPQSNGDIFARDSLGVYLGKYQACSDYTLDSMGRYLYRGNMVTALIPPLPR